MMRQNAHNAMRYVLLAVGGFLLASVVRTAHASPTLLTSNYAVAYDAGVVRCTGNPGTDCDRPDF